MECIYLEQNTHTLRFRKDGVHLSRMKYPHSEIFKRWSAVSRMEYPHSEVLERWSALSRMECPHSEVLERWSSLPRQECPHSEVSERWSALFRKECPHSKISERWSTLFRKECPHSEVSERWSPLSRTEYPHSEVLERWNIPFWNRTPTLRGFRKMQCILPLLEVFIRPFWAAHFPLLAPARSNLSAAAAWHHRASLMDLHLSALIHTI